MIEYQSDNVDPALVKWTAVLLLVLIGSASFMGVVLYRANHVRLGSKSRAEDYLQPPEPRLQVNEVQARKAYQEAQKFEMGSYGWIDDKEGIVRVPIERAMDLILKKGLPSTPLEGKSK